MGAALAHSRSKTPVHENIWSVLSILIIQNGFCVFYGNEWNLAPPLYTRGKTKVKAVDRSWFSAKEGNQFYHMEKSRCHCFGTKGVLYIGYFEKGTTIIWRLFRCFTRRKTPGLQKKTSFFNKQCTCQQNYSDNENLKAWLWIVGKSSLLPLRFCCHTFFYSLISTDSLWSAFLSLIKQYMQLARSSVIWCRLWIKQWVGAYYYQ